MQKHFFHRETSEQPLYSFSIFHISDHTEYTTLWDKAKEICVKIRESPDDAQIFDSCLKKSTVCDKI